jgi:hypothetical protein
MNKRDITVLYTQRSWLDDRNKTSGLEIASNLGISNSTFVDLDGADFQRNVCIAPDYWSPPFEPAVRRLERPGPNDRSRRGRCHAEPEIHPTPAFPDDASSPYANSSPAKGSSRPEAYVPNGNIDDEKTWLAT